MDISREEITHIAELSRLKLSEAEKIKFGGQLGAVLEHIDKLNEIDAEKINSTASASGLNNVFRNDEVKAWDESEVSAALEQGEIEAGQVKVKRVL